MKIPFNQIPIGAEVWIDLPIGRHFGRKYADNDVIHFSKKHRAIRVDSYADFADEQPIFTTITDNLPTQQEMALRANQIIKQGYSLLNHNCEHVKEVLAGNPPTSVQVQGTVGGAALGLGIARLAGYGPWGLCAGLVLGGLLGLTSANKTT